MYSSDTDAHNHVDSHVLRRIMYVTCQTSHLYNKLPVLFSNFVIVAQISSLLGTLIYEIQQYIKGIIVFILKKVCVPLLSTVGVEVSKVWFSFVDPVFLVPP